VSGWRGRIGFIYPGDGVLDSEYASYMPAGVTCHITRVSLDPGDYTLEHAERLARSSELEQAARTFLLIQPSAVALACSSGSFVGGAGADLEIGGRIGLAAGCPGTTASTGMVEAFRSLGIRRPGLFSPYEPAITRRLCEFLCANGFPAPEVVGATPHGPIGSLQPSEVYRVVMAFKDLPVDGVFLACTALDTRELRPALASDLNRPVLSASQVAAWHALTLARIDPIPLF